MQTIHATEAAEAATNINRVDWIHGAAELVLSNQVQYDRSTSRYSEFLISRADALENVSCTSEYEALITEWLDGGECCDCRDKLRVMVLDEIMQVLSEMADDFNIGVE